MGAPTLKLAEVIVHVDDVAEQLAFYRDKLGLGVAHVSPGWVLLDAGGCRLALHGGGRVAGASNVRLAFEVGDVHAARAELVARGVVLGEVRSPAPGVLVCDGVDPEGNDFSIDSHS